MSYAPIHISAVSPAHEERGQRRSFVEEIDSLSSSQGALPSSSKNKRERQQRKVQEQEEQEEKKRTKRGLGAAQSVGIQTRQVKNRSSSASQLAGGAQASLGLERLKIGTRSAAVDGLVLVRQHGERHLRVVLAKVAARETITTE